MTEPNDHEDEWHDLLFGVRRSVRYHDRRVKFFDRVRKFISISTLLAGSGTIITAVSSTGPTYIIIASAIVAFLSAVDLVFDPAGYARLHNSLKRRFIGLECDMTLADISTTDINQSISARLTIEADEPPVLRVLDIVCHNEMLRSMGYDKSHFKSISSIQRLFAPFMDINADKIT